MSERNHSYPDWDDSVYGNGPTEPPKNRGALVALMLILIIFLCGIVTMLSLMNIRLFRELRTDKQEKDLAISFTTEPTEEAVNRIAPTQTPAPAAVSAPNATMNLQAAPKGVDNIPEGGGMSLQDIYTRNIPSVVSITCQGRRSASSGTGVVLSADGYIVTNAHVVENAYTYSVQLTDDRSFSARLVGCDDISDLAVLRIDCTDLTPAQFGDSSTLRVGDTVVAIGDPLGAAFRGTYTDGIVSAINRDVDINGRTMTLIQTNAALNSGNSGGPLINCYGQVIGINTMKIGAFTDTAGVEGLGFAIPSTQVKEIVDQIVAQGYVSGRPTLGITGEALSTFYQHYYRMPAGLYITEVDPGSDAAYKGIQEGDLLLYLDDTRIVSADDLRNAVYEYEVGEAVEAIIYSQGQQYRVELTLGEDVPNYG
ncbi:MAG: trypsin-like peptidase domain-containing protein [Clostridiales bacterium]|nr:trypsin-like peptidase domain-containing protein [Clostridiales bacterium]MCI6935439.1 trypsin-like peptidase domain-containing protein [Clostridiales bacterium]MDD5882960.1 trypsin-like peptidase domain-containing protein [Bacillota bacterium]